MKNLTTRQLVTDLTGFTDKIHSVINSCVSPQHFASCLRMIDNLEIRAQREFGLNQEDAAIMGMTLTSYMRGFYGSTKAAKYITWAEFLKSNVQI